jgi:hypothetical protein
MVSGYCKCSFPATHVCKICGAKYCNNCAPNHKCAEKVEEVEQSAPVINYEKKPGRPRIKK